MQLFHGRCVASVVAVAHDGAEARSSQRDFAMP